VGVAPAPAARLVAIARREVGKRGFERKREHLFAGLDRRRAHVVAPAREIGITREDVAEEHGARKPVAAERLAQLYAERDPVYRSAGTVVLTDRRPLREIVSHVLRIYRSEVRERMRR